MLKVEQEKILSPFLSLTVSSPAMVSAKVEELKARHNRKEYYISLALVEPQVLTMLFNFRKATMKELEQDLIHDASDLLSLPIKEIEFDFQIFSSGPTHVEGLYICAPKTVVKKYLSEMDKTRLIPVKMTSYAADYINFLSAKHEKMVGIICFIDFSQEALVHFVVMDGVKCKFLRKVKYENQRELRDIVIQTLQGASAQSPTKRFDRICLTGARASWQEVLPHIKKEFEAEIECWEMDETTERFLKKNFLRVNFIKKYVFSLRFQKAIMIVSYAVMCVLCMQNIFLAIEIRYKDIYTRLQEISYSEVNYQYAKELEEKLQ